MLSFIFIAVCDYIKDTRSKIIGKEATILDCLEWFNKIGKQATITWKGYFKSNKIDGRGQCEIVAFKIDLSKPYLFQQSEELISFFYDCLIMSKKARF